MFFLNKQSRSFIAAATLAFVCTLSFPSQANNKWWNGSFWVWDVTTTLNLTSNFSGVVRMLADNSTLNMNGFDITGPGNNIGISVVGYDYVTINGDGGEVTNITTGIYVVGSDYCTMDEVSVDAFNIGIQVQDSYNPVIQDCEGYADTYMAAYIADASHQARIFDNYFHNCGRSGVWVEYSNYASVNRNKLMGNYFDGITTYQTTGSFMDSDTCLLNGYGLANNYRHGIGLFNSTSPTVWGCRLLQNSCYGIYQQSSTGITLSSNYFYANGCGDKNF